MDSEVHLIEAIVKGKSYVFWVNMLKKYANKRTDAVWPSANMKKGRRPEEHLPRLNLDLIHSTQEVIPDLLREPLR